MKRRVFASSTRTIRRLIQLGVVGLFSYVAIRHQVSGTAPLDSYCPFGAIETLPSLLSGDGFINKVGQSNLVLLAAALIVSLLASGAFCGWLCPFGAVQEWLSALARRIFGRQLTVPAGVHRYLKHLRWGVLVLIVVMSARYMGLWFADYDPFRAMFHFKFENALAIGLVVGTVVGALAIERFWCMYACPLGALVGLAGLLGITKVRRDVDVCTSCGICSKACPSRIDVASAPRRVADMHCTMCTECVDACPESGALVLSTGAKGEAFRPLAVGLAATALFFALIGTSFAMGWWVPSASCGGCSSASESVAPVSMESLIEAVGDK